MGSFQKNPLYRRPGRADREVAREKWRRTEASKAMRQVKLALSSASRAGANMGGSLQKLFYRLGAGGLSLQDREAMFKHDFTGTVKELEKYAKQGGMLGAEVKAFLKMLGPVGSLIGGIIGKGNRKQIGSAQADIQNALEFLNAVAPETLSGPGRRRARGTGSGSLGKISDQLEAARELLEANGYEVKEREAPQPRVPAPEQRTPGRPQYAEVVIDGQTRRFPLDHPLVTGVAIPATGSSNVHSFAYLLDKRRLYVRYLASKTPGRGKGTLYAYENVPPKVFLAMMNAGSKGTFIWDHIRVRGSVTDHRYGYRLFGVIGGYVPRRAVKINGEQFLIRRNFELVDYDTREKKNVRSILPNQRVNRGTPNRGTPNNGAPNRGR